MKKSDIWLNAVSTCLWCTVRVLTPILITNRIRWRACLMRASTSHWERILGRQIPTWIYSRKCDLSPGRMLTYHPT